MSVALSDAWGQLPTLRLEPVAEDRFDSPVAVTHAGDGSGRLFVVEQRGRVMVVENGTVLDVPFLDIGDRLVAARANFDERGLLSLAFHPGYAVADAPGEGKFYVYYSAPSPDAPGTPAAPVDHRSVIAEFSVSAENPAVADATTERVLLTFNQPQFNHNGGQLAFGPDAMLYVGTGDGGGSDDNGAGHSGGSVDKPDGVLGNAQDLTRLLGKILRIDPLGDNAAGGAYGVPEDNPFAQAPDEAVRPEIWALGLRNPWRFSFDDGTDGTDRLLVADVGQAEVEEINIVERGRNYGWRIREGSQDFDAGVPGAAGLTLEPPVAEYAHPGVGNGMQEFGISVTGGYVYRGAAIPGLQGVYVFGDWSRSFGSPGGSLLAMTEAGNGFALSLLDVEGGNPLTAFVPAFGEDEDGELYVATKRILAPSGPAPTGSVFRIVAAQSGPEPVTVTLEPALDNSMFREEPTFSNGRGQYLFVGETRARQNGARRALLHFDVAGSVPAGSTILEATLSLRMNRTIVGHVAVSAHRVSAQWGEGSSNAGGQEGAGTQARDGDATWAQRLFGSEDWSNPGGDFAVVASATTPVGGNGRHSWASEPLKADVQAFLDQPDQNFGWILIAPEGGEATAKRFDSREATNTANRPTLEITYIAPRENPATARERWIASFFAEGEAVDFQQDLDGDTLAGQLEYAFNFDPKARNRLSEGFTVAVDAARGSLVVSFLRNADAADLTYRVEVSRDLGEWTAHAESVSGSATILVDGGGNGIIGEEAVAGSPMKRVTLDIPAGNASPMRYVRLVVVMDA